MRITVTGTLGAVALAGALCSCAGHSHAAAQGTPISSASLQAMKAQGEKILLKCVPTDPAAQVAWAATLKSSDGRKKFEDCEGIPAAQRQAFEGAALGAAEKTKLTDKSDRAVYFGTTLPNLVQQYQAKATASPSPSAKAKATGG